MPFLSLLRKASFSQWLMLDVPKGMLELQSHPSLLPGFSFNTASQCNRQWQRGGGRCSSKYHKPSHPEISHQWSLHHFQSKPLTPSLKSGHCVCKIGDSSSAVTRSGCSGHCDPPQFPSTHTLLSLWMSSGFFPLLLTKQQRKIIVENFVIKKLSVGYTIQNHNSFFSPTVHQLCAIGTYLRQLSKKICLQFKDKQVFSKQSKGLFSSLLPVEKPQKKE